MVEWVSKNPRSLQTLRLRMKAELNIEVSVSTVAQYLDERPITMKKLQAVEESANTHENKMWRKAYVLAQLQSETERGQAVWIDETIFNLFCARTMKCSPHGTPARCAVPNSRGQNLHLLGSLTSTGLIDYTIM
ncbi:unnamed protein product [Dicrocoelium dendriticum]|nr:unnamed protein product [Dicrocoelium dendriticum]